MPIHYVPAYPVSMVFGATAAINGMLRIQVKQ